MQTIVRRICCAPPPHRRNLCPFLWRSAGDGAKRSRFEAAGLLCRLPIPGQQWNTLPHVGRDAQHHASSLQKLALEIAALCMVAQRVLTRTVAFCRTQRQLEVGPACKPDCRLQRAPVRIGWLQAPKKHCSRPMQYTLPPGSDVNFRCNLFELTSSYQKL